MMKADPRPGTPSYSQGYAPPPFNWTDRGKVDKVGQKTCVRTGCYEHVLVIAESSEEEGPDAEQLKYYAPGVGYVRVGWRGKGEKLRETLELVEVVKLDPEALAKVRAEALELEKRASVYGRTPPAEIMPAWPASDKSDSLGPQVRAGRGHAMGQRGFFDVERRLDGISAKGDPLETIKLLLANSGMRACRASLGRVIFLVVPSMGGWSALPFFPP